MRNETAGEVRGRKDGTTTGSVVAAMIMANVDNCGHPRPQCSVVFPGNPDSVPSKCSTEAAQAFDIRRPKTLIGRPRRFIDPGFEIGGLLDKAGCNVRV